MKIVTPAQMTAIDACAINEYGIPGLLLMENAASAVTAEAISILGGTKGKTVTVVAGRGNNGGDAFAAARLLHSRGVSVRVWLIGAKTGISGDAGVNLTILERIGIQLFELLDDNNLESLSLDISKSQLILDGLFGTGLGREVSGLYAAAVIKINASGKPVLAIDIPSGIDGLDGSIKGICINASVTITFTMPKIGLVIHPGCEYTGKLVVADIGIPPCVISKQAIQTELIDREMVSGMIPARKANSNKGDYGKVLMVTGSTGMTGSGCLASMAALRTGAGLVYTGVPQSLSGIYGAMMKEPIILPLKEDVGGCLAAESAEEILAHMKKMDVTAIGPGLTSADSIRKLVENVVLNSKIPLVLDADALNSISGNTLILKKLGTDTVVTPHPGEMARLTGLSISDIQKDRIGTAVKFASEYGVTTVLKGSRTIVAQPGGQVYINTTGNAGMASAGMGDVLTGIIAALMAQGSSAGEAAISGVFLHGLAGDTAAEKLGMQGMLAGDVVEQLPCVMKNILSIGTIAVER